MNYGHIPLGICLEAQYDNLMMRQEKSGDGSILSVEIGEILIIHSFIILV